MKFSFQVTGLFVDGHLHNNGKSVKDTKKAVAEQIKLMLGMI
jgi:hypothetical protein